MPFTDQEKINQGDLLSLQLYGIANAPAGQQQWYSALYPWKPIIAPDKIWNQFTSIPSASTSIVADANVLANPSILEKKVLRLTAELTSNYRGFIARTTYNNTSSAQLENWILPSIIRDNGSPSNGYSIKLYHGDPYAGGIEISTAYMAGSDGSPSWSFLYPTGIIICSTDIANNFKTFYNTNGLWILGYRYIGTTGGSGGGSGANDASLVTAEIELTHPFDPNYPTDEFALVVTDNDGNVLNDGTGSGGGGGGGGGSGFSYFPGGWT